eukprot:CAMPEP_0181294070 /NCGR_PEP_ID=MMETSP1101-20121128/3399_1 /TAXON_ID=46948 /ORGANISM="Rhodomonas abbreviata, Strain Caron Lab Isolate" /LENGTH=62 /DNA_ID=CAMNT_0023398693 /DNA_START=133 /DNA_END=321 /DNA_ORIENTATION=-
MRTYAVSYAPMVVPSDVGSLSSTAIDNKASAVPGGAGGSELIAQSFPPPPSSHLQQYDRESK